MRYGKFMIVGFHNPFLFLFSPPSRFNFLFLPNKSNVFFWRPFFPPSFFTFKFIGVSFCFSQFWICYPIWNVLFSVFPIFTPIVSPVFLDVSTLSHCSHLNHAITDKQEKKLGEKKSCEKEESFSTKSTMVTNHGLLISWGLVQILLLHVYLQLAWLRVTWLCIPGGLLSVWWEPCYHLESVLCASSVDLLERSYIHSGYTAPVRPVGILFASGFGFMQRSEQRTSVLRIFQYRHN